MKLEKVELFSNKKELLFFISISLFILTYSLLFEYRNYKQLTRFDSAIVDAKVLKQYEKTKNGRTYQVLKLRDEHEFIFYTTVKKGFEDVKGKKLKLEIFLKNISFYQYLTQFYAFSKVIDIKPYNQLKDNLNSYIDSKHQSPDIASIYKALYTAEPLPYHLQKIFSSLGVSHLLAISGFHLGVLSAVLYFLLTPVYKFFQDRFFPYRNSKRDVFLVISTVLLGYLLFLDTPPSLLRAFTMLVVGFFLYDKHIKIISMQTLSVTLVLLLVFFPRLFFSIGFWLSICGVYYIFLFLIYFEHMSKLKQFILLPIWLYITMLIFSVTLFGSFSIYHPLSIIWTSLFTLFYPFSIVLHLIGFADLFDSLLDSFIALGIQDSKVVLGMKYLYIHIVLSLLSLWKRWFVWMLIGYSFYIFFKVWSF
jgi:competence protein ComEC